MLSGEATNTNFIVFGLTQSGLEPTIYRTHGEHANQYSTDAVLYFPNPSWTNFINEMYLCFLILSIINAFIFKCLK